MAASKLVASGAGSTKWRSLMNLLMQLRKTCNHPYLFAGAEDDPDETSLEELVGASGKLRVLDRMLLKLHERDHRVVLFSQFSSMVDLLDDYCRLRGWPFVRLTGSTNRVQRMVNLQAFNAPSSKLFLFLMTTRAGGLGINLQSADTCILLDSDWNPQADLQCAASPRTHDLLYPALPSIPAIALSGPNVALVRVGTERWRASTALASRSQSTSTDSSPAARRRSASSSALRRRCAELHPTRPLGKMVPTLLYILCPKRRELARSSPRVASALPLRDCQPRSRRVARRRRREALGLGGPLDDPIRSGGSLRRRQP